MADTGAVTGSGEREAVTELEGSADSDVMDLAGSDDVTTVTQTRTSETPSVRDQAKDRTQGSARQAKDKVADAAQQAKQQASEKLQGAAQQAQEKAQDVGQRTRGQLRSTLEQRSSQAGEQAQTVAQAIRRSADELRQQGKEGPARLVEQAAGKLDDVGNYLRVSDGDRILSDIESFARRQPLVVAAAGLVAGFLGSRFLKASSAKRYEMASTPRSYGELPAAGYTADVGPTIGYDVDLHAEPLDEITAAPVRDDDRAWREDLDDAGAI